MKGPQFLRFYAPIVSVLKELGGSGRAGEVTDLVIQRVGCTEEELSETLKSGGSRVRNQVAFARLYLVKAGHLDSSERGVWTLTQKGANALLDDESVLAEARRVQRQMSLNRRAQKEDEQEGSQVDDPDESSVEDYRNELLNILRSVPADSFEKICQRLFRESGFQQVVVTGRSGDGGIDGHGVLQINAFASFKVLFQSKRYQGNVSASQVRDFRGAMAGRADQGIILTTGGFTMDAKSEARRDGVAPIELVDGEGLVDIIEQLRLGLKPKTTFEVDYTFFQQYGLGQSS